MASKIEGKANVIAYSWNYIKGKITPESYYSTAKNSCLGTIKNFDQKLRDKKDLIERLSPPGSQGRIPELFDKKFEQRTTEFSKIKTTKNLGLGQSERKTS